MGGRRFVQSRPGRVPLGRRAATPRFIKQAPNPELRYSYRLPALRGRFLMPKPRTLAAGTSIRLGLACAAVGGAALQHDVALPDRRTPWIALARRVTRSQWQPIPVATDLNRLPGSKPEAAASWTIRLYSM